MTTTANDGLAEAAALGGEAPAGITDRDWHHMVADGADAIAGAQSEENDGTPEEYAAAAIRAALPDAFRIAYARAQSVILAEARRGVHATPGRQHITYTGGLRRAAKVLDPLLAAAMAAEDDR